MEFVLVENQIKTDVSWNLGSLHKQEIKCWLISMITFTTWYGSVKDEDKLKLYAIVCTTGFRNLN